MTPHERRTGNASHFPWLCLAACLAAVVAPWRAGLAGQAPPSGATFRVTAFVLSYGGVDDPKHALHGGHPGLPPLADLMQTEVTLGTANGELMAPLTGAQLVSASLATITEHAQKFHPSAIVTLQRQLVAALNRRGLIGVFVAAHPDDLTVTRKGGPVRDSRPADRTALRLVVWTGVVGRVRTVASGEVVPEDVKTDHPRHARIRDRSPVRPRAEGDAERRDLLDKDALERYAQFLSRHPGRRVDVSLSPGETPGTMHLDYLVHEVKPWYAFVQGSNTGTQYTSDWRERFGFVHNQLTGHDDILRLDYITAGFDEAHAVLASYEAPFFDYERLRWRVGGTWHKYTASDVGLLDAEFEGRGWSASADLIWNVLQHERLFVDLIGGLRWEQVRVEDALLGTEAEADLLIPYVGARAERLTGTAATYGSLLLEWFDGGFTNTGVEELTALGRFAPDEDAQVLKLDAFHSVYLEPLLDRAAWEDPATPGTSTLAHEVALALRGQHTLGARLIPQMQQVVGGLYTVRGYPESIVAGDNVYVGSLEYRFHVPRVFKPSKEAVRLPLFGTPFRMAPPSVYGRPDWDLVLRAFFDIGRAESEDPLPFETDETIAGTGVGVELRVKDNLSVRVDYAVALDDIERGDHHVDAGDSRIHAVITLSY